jgi:hypothetical protein
MLSWRVVMRTPLAQADKPELLIIDQKDCAKLGSPASLKIACFLEIWAEPMELALRNVVPDAPIHLSCAPANCKMIIVSLGSVSIEDPQYQALTKRVRRLPAAPNVVH